MFKQKIMMSGIDTNMILEVQNLSISFGEKEQKMILHNADFSLRKNKITGLTGQSGSGKSLLVSTILRLTENKQNINIKGSIFFNLDNDTIDLLKCSEAEIEQIRGKQISMVFQDPYSSFDPRLKCGAQLVEVIRLHTGKSRKDSIAMAKEHLVRSGLDDRVFDSYPHQVSGGELQRVAFVIALASSPGLLIADEPVTNLDMVSKRKILDMIKEINQEKNLSVLYISHDLESIGYLTDEVFVLKDGVIAQGDIEKMKKDLVFDHIDIPIPAGGDTVIKIESISKTFKRNRFFDVFSKRMENIALKDINLVIDRGDITGIVGESGSGKTTLGRIMVGLEKFDAGRYIFEGKDYTDASEKELRKLREKIQMVYQNPANSLNPAVRNSILVNEPFEVAGTKLNREERWRRIETVFGKMNLKTDILDRFPGQLSGGEAQRLAIARILLLEPDVIVFDEALSSLDWDNQYELLGNLLNIKLDKTYIFITHDIRMIKNFCNKIIVMKEGEIVESGSTGEILNSPKSEYTKQLLDAIF